MDRFIVTAQSYPGTVTASLSVHYEYVINDFRLYNFLTRTVLLIVYSWTTAQKRGNQRTLITYPENLLPEI